MPFLVLAATSSLLQGWLSRSELPGREDPYFLYAASNAGSLLALLVYPLLFDPLLGLAAQVQVWRGAGVGFLVLLFVVGGRFWGQAMDSQPAQAPEPVRSRSGEGGGPCLDAGESLVPAGPSRWLILSLVPSSLMLAVTAHMSQEVPSVPLLWVTPLFLYLLSFTLVFARRSPPRWIFQGLLPLLLAVLAVVLYVPTRVLGFSLHLGALFVAAMVLHELLARSRPSPERLTGYYLWLALGGALGGVFNSLIAPALFPFLAEYPLMLVLAAWLGIPAPSPTDSPWPRRFDGLAPLLLSCFLALVLTILPRVGDERDVVARVAVLFLAAAVTWTFRLRSCRFALGLAAVLGGGFGAFRLPGTLAFRRSSYGVHRVSRLPDRKIHQLYHGSTLHGVQDLSQKRAPPLAYFYPESPVGEILAHHLPGGARVAVIGLGVGSVAWYAGSDWDLRYFELDPVVVELAREVRFFTHLKEARGKVEVRLGDGRLQLSRESEASFDLVFADAFSSDAVPVHLLTREAVDMYLGKLRPGGALLFNTSNRHLRLEALLGVLARDLGLTARACLPPPLIAEQEQSGWARASFVLLVRDSKDLAIWLEAPGTSKLRPWREIPEDPGPVWRDDYVSLLPYLRW
jgi:hypothetical protein